MREISDPDELRSALKGSENIGFVPTMGALHAGHRALLDAARTENQTVVLSIYVNPSQFGRHEDLARYPRDLDRDLDLANSAGVDIAFTPDDHTMYTDGLDGQIVWVDPGRLGSTLEGEARPGHFRGVATVVAKLFNMVAPERAYFGQKDAQQVVVVRRLVRDLNMRVDVRVVPTVREADGLAMSSRNVYLTVRQRDEAAAIFRGLQAATSVVAEGERDAAAVIRSVRRVIEAEAPSSRIDYVALTDSDSLEPVVREITVSSLLSVVVFFGSTRLIDNVTLTPPEYPTSS